jgi:hypothetical protein
MGQFDGTVVSHEAVVDDDSSFVSEGFKKGLE